MSLRGVASHLALALVPLALLLGLAEAVVRLTGADQTCPNRFSGLQIWACDPILQFKLNPEIEVLGQKLSRDGLRTHELAPKPAGVYRILALGDSCTFGQLQRGDVYGYVADPYPRVLEALLADRVGPGRFEVFNAGIPGYNSHQGLMLLRGKLRNLDPDLISVRFGWNDIFLSEAPPGKGPYRESDSRLWIAFEDLALRTALYPFVRRLGFELRAWRGQTPDALRRAFVNRTRWAPTVALADYEHNLRRIVEIGRARGAQVWLLTSPYNRAASERARSFVSFNNRIEFDALMAEHERYNEATRALGRELDAPVIDMDAIYRASHDPQLFVASDAIHPSERGHQLEADALFRALVARGIAAPKSATDPGKAGGA